MAKIVQNPQSAGGGGRASVPLEVVGPGWSGGLQNAMNKYCKWFLLVSLLGLAAGFADVGGSMVSGFARAMGAVFFILFFVTNVVSAAAEDK